MTSAATPRFFRTPAALRRWFARHHAIESEFFLGYWKVGSGERSVTWPESVDEALCVGWIDGVRRRIDEYAKLLKANRKVWAHFEARAPSYRKAVLWWIVSAKQEATRHRRLALLI